MTLFEAMRQVLQSKRVEPQKRLVGGRFGWAIHRFPVKGGKSLLETAVADNVVSNNAVFRRLKERAK